MSTSKIFSKHVKMFPTLMNVPIPTMGHVLWNRLLYYIFVFPAKSVFELKDLHKKHQVSFRRVKSIICILTHLNSMLNYPIACPFILIDEVPLNTQFHVMQYISKFLLFPVIPKNMQNFDINLTLSFDSKFQEISNSKCFYYLVLLPQFYSIALFMEMPLISFCCAIIS